MGISVKASSDDKEKQLVLRLFVLQRFLITDERILSHGRKRKNNEFNVFLPAELPIGTWQSYELLTKRLESLVQLTDQAEVSDVQVDFFQVIFFPFSHDRQKGTGGQRTLTFLLAADFEFFC